MPAGETLHYKNEHLANWTGHPSGDDVPLDFRRGQVVVKKDPDAPTIARMIELAATLGARVQGDDGAWYDDAPSARRPQRRWPWRR